MSFPAAAGVRVTWNELPVDLRDAVERRAGASVTAADSQPGGFSPGLASRLQLEDGRRLFVKAVSARTNPDSPSLHRREARITAELPQHAPAPRLQFWFEHGDWVVLAFDDIDGVHPQLPWNPDELTLVLLALHELARTLTPSPVACETVAETIGETLMQWRVLSQRADERARLPAGLEQHIDELIALEREWPDRARGDSLVHLDVRADNVLLADGRCIFVDWPWAAVGAAWLDLAELCVSMAMQGGPHPESVWRAHPLARDVADDDLDAFLAGFAGFLTRMAMQPPAPGLPTLRPFQAAQAVVARRWLAERRGWE